MTYGWDGGERRGRDYDMANPALGPVSAVYADSCPSGVLGTAQSSLIVNRSQGGIRQIVN